MFSDTERPPAPRRLPSLHRRLLVFAAAVLAPVLVGALVCGVLLLLSASRSQQLAEELVEESAVSVGLIQNLQTARIAGSAYMEEGEREDLAEYRGGCEAGGSGAGCIDCLRRRGGAGSP